MKAFWSHSVSANLLYHDLPGDGVPLIFLPGLGCASSCDYPRIASDHVLSGRRSFLVDLMGAGFSDRPVSFSYSIEDHARTVAELVTHVASGSVDLFGHSMGGSVAIVATHILGGRVAHLALSEPNLDPGGGIFSKRIAAMPEADYVAWGHDDLCKAAKADGNTIWAASLAGSAPYAVHRGATSLILGSKPSWRELLFALGVPRTVIFGENSLPHRDVEMLPQGGVAIDIVPAAGHSIAWDNPAGLAVALHRATS